MLSPYQFQMFMPARDLANPEKFGHYDTGGYESHEHMAQEKRNESRRAGSHSDTHSDAHGFGSQRGVPSLMESIASHGVRKPVEIQSPHAVAERARTGYWTDKPGDSPLWGAVNPDLSSGKPMVVDGHHRVFSAEAVDPNMEVPVRYDWEGPGGSLKI